jgi:excisionase family DNA binding protein
MDPVLMTPERAAEALAISRSRLYELIGRNEIASIKIGRSRRILTSAISEYALRLVEQQTEDSPVVG